VDGAEGVDRDMRTLRLRGQPQIEVASVVVVVVVVVVARGSLDSATLTLCRSRHPLRYGVMARENGEEVNSGAAKLQPWL
jgi:hypothetical protein